MATRFYYVANTAPPVTPAFDGGWNSTTGAVRRLMDVAKAATTEQSTVSIGTTGPTYTCQVQLVSPPLAAQTISGTVTVISRGRENTTNANVNKRARSVRVVSGDGLTVRGTSAAWAATTSTTELSGTTLQGQQHALTAALTSVTVLDGDRLVVEVGYGVGTSGTSPQGLMEWGGTGTDHGTANADVTGSVPWIEFSQDLVFQSAATVFGTGAASFGFTATAAGVREVPATAAGGFGFTAAAAGVRAVPGQSSAPLGFTAAAAGVGFAGASEVFGIAGAALGFTATTAAARTVLGAAAALLGFSGTATGVREVLGRPSAVLGITAGASGTASTPGAVVDRPDMGLVVRPTAGTVTRPDTGVVTRAAGIVARPDAGVVARP